MMTSVTSNGGGSGGGFNPLMTSPEVSSLTSTTAQPAAAAESSNGGSVSGLTAPSPLSPTAAIAAAAAAAAAAGLTGGSSTAPNGDDIPDDPGKMFIGGLSWQTTPESIREYFSAFGELAEVMVMKDPATRRSRGFGFITFSDPRSVDDVLKYPVHQLDGKLVEPKVAVPRKTNPKLVMRTRKIFVGGLSSTTSLEDIKAYFEQFSKVREAMLAYDKITNRHRGFGFVTFDNEDVVDKICEIHFHEIKGKMVESKKALPKEPRLSYYNNYGSPSGHLAYGHFSPGRHGNMFGSYGGYGGGMRGYPGGGGGPQGYGGGGHHHQQQQYNHQYNGGGGSYDLHMHREQQQDGGSSSNRQNLLQMGHFDNANYGSGNSTSNNTERGNNERSYDNGNNDMRYYSSMSKSMSGGDNRMDRNTDRNGFNTAVERNNFYNNKDFATNKSSSGGDRSGAFTNYRDSNGRHHQNERGGMTDAYDRSSGHLESLGGGGNLSGMLSNGYYGSSRDYGGGRHHHLGGAGDAGGGGRAVNNNNNVVQPYSTSAGSGGSADNSAAGYEDDFPELTTSKFNNLGLTGDASSPTSTPNEMNRTGPSSAFVAF